MKKSLDLSSFGALSESAQLLHSSLSLEEILRHLLRSAMGHLLVKCGFIALRETSQIRIAIIRGITKIKAGELFDPAALQAAGITLILPIGDQQDPIGFLGIGTPVSGSISSTAAEFLQALLGIAANVIARARAHEQANRLNQELGQKVQDLRALLDFAQGLKTTLAPQNLVSMLVLTLSGRWSVRRFAITVWRSGHAPISRQKGIQLPPVEQLRDWLAILPTAALVTDLPDSKIKALLESEGAEVILPLQAGSLDSYRAESVAGILVLGPRPGQRLYQATDLEFGAGLVSQTVVALENAWHHQEMLAQQKLEARQQARKETDQVFSTLTEVLPGMVLDEKYRLDRKIGIGGFGAVYQGMHLELNRTVAIKVFRPLRDNNTPAGLERFRREGISACRINHPNAVSIYDFGISQAGIAYLVMELLQGRTLADELRSGKILSPARCAEILIPICNLLTEAHNLGIVHRDIKPENIFLHNGSEGELVKVVDFGLAKMFVSEPGQRAEHLTLGGNILGTPAYMSPERLQGKECDGQADLYSLGVLLYEMLTGALPFISMENNPFTLAMMQIVGQPLKLREINPNVPSAIDDLVMQALAKDPRQRPSAKDLANQFMHALESLPDCPTNQPIKTPVRKCPDYYSDSRDMPTIDESDFGLRSKK